MNDPRIFLEDSYMTNYSARNRFVLTNKQPLRDYPRCYVEQGIPEKILK